MSLHPRTAAKRPKHRHRHHQSLLPGLPDHIAQLCLCLVPPSSLYSVCRSWRRLIYYSSFPPFPSIYALFSSSENNLHFSSFDPISRQWIPLPPPPQDPPLRRLLFRHPAFLSRKLPIQSVTVSGKLVLLAATADQLLPALSHPLIFDPPLQTWTHGPPLSAPRRWCAAGALRGAAYVASGIGSHYDNDVARSVEKWDLDDLSAVVDPKVSELRLRWKWEKMAKLRDAKFSREAIDAVGWREKLCMVNVKGDAAKEGIIYNVGADSWEEMPEGMLAGWRGPAAAMAEETIFAVDESKGMLNKYDHVKDAWVEIVENQLLKGAQQLAAAAGKVCVLCADGMRIAVVDVAAPPPARVWVVEVPPGFQALGIHVLPRFSISVD
ncbi:KAR-UP F-box 1 [Perilla frutescens var. hirtella]|nr:KAR-UP F-box 1 [Perilla frutescens var. frutescens]KAH6783559.1 KAR-UP F-box 1 [Perilla frutescens var. hirtella]